MRKVRNSDIQNVIKEVNKTLTWYKRGGWIDARRTPTSGENFVEDMQDYVEARFNRESWDVPELNEACEVLEGRLFSCTLEDVDEERKKFSKATLKLISEDEIENPSPELIETLRKVRTFLGGSKIIFNSVKVRVKYEISD